MWCSFSSNSFVEQNRGPHPLVNPELLMLGLRLDHQQRMIEQKDLQVPIIPLTTSSLQRTLVQQLTIIIS